MHNVYIVTDCKVLPEHISPNIWLCGTDLLATQPLAPDADHVYWFSEAPPPPCAMLFDFGFVTFEGPQVRGACRLTDFTHFKIPEWVYTKELLQHTPKRVTRYGTVTSSQYDVYNSTVDSMNARNADNTYVPIHKQQRIYAVVYDGKLIITYMSVMYNTHGDIFDLQDPLPILPNTFTHRDMRTAYKTISEILVEVTKEPLLLEVGTRLALQINKLSPNKYPLNTIPSIRSATRNKVWYDLLTLLGCSTSEMYAAIHRYAPKDIPISSQMCNAYADIRDMMHNTSLQVDDVVKLVEPNARIQYGDDGYVYNYLGLALNIPSSNQDSEYYDSVRMMLLHRMVHLRDQDARAVKVADAIDRILYKETYTTKQFIKYISMLQYSDIKDVRYSVPKCRVFRHAYREVMKEGVFYDALLIRGFPHPKHVL